MEMWREPRCDIPCAQAGSLGDVDGLLQFLRIPTVVLLIMPVLHCTVERTWLFAIARKTRTEFFLFIVDHTFGSLMMLAYPTDLFRASFFKET